MLLESPRGPPSTVYISAIVFSGEDASVACNWTSTSEEGLVGHILELSLDEVIWSQISVTTAYALFYYNIDFMH